MKNALQKYIWLAILETALVSSQGNEIFILGNDYCITNGSSAIAFNELDTSSDTQELLMYPPPPISTFNCNFDDVDSCNSWEKGSWYQQSSFNVSNPDVITDRRWEEMTTWFSKKTERNNKNVYTNILKILDDLSFAISIRLSVEGHIFLCDGDSPISSSCYWIMLGSDGGTTSKIRKCPKGFVPEEKDKYPGDPCKTPKFQVNENPLVDTWNHFILEKNKNLLRVYKRNKEVFLEYVDPEPLKISNMFIHSKKGTGYWKIHNFNFLESQIADSIIQLGPTINPINDKICISMFVKTSPTSELTIRIKNRDLSYEMPAYSTNGVWKQIQIFHDDVPDAAYRVYFLKKTVDPDSAYWAIDDVRVCNQVEYRYIKASTSSSRCERIEDSVSLDLTSETPLTNEGITCSESSFSQQCVPCKIFNREYCKSFKYCEEDMGLTKCFCTAGYQGINCKQACSDGFYGHGCSQKSNCNTQYDKVNGFCPNQQCKDPYTGFYCEYAKYAVFKNPPTVNNVKIRSFTVVQDNLEILGDGNYYYFQYAEDQSNYWANASGAINIDQMEEVTVDAPFITSDTIYKVKAVVVDKKFKESLNGPTTTFSTKCTHLTENDINIETFNTSAVVQLVQTADMCRVNNHKYSLDGRGDVPIFLDKFTIPNLKPFREYSLTIKYYSKINNDVFEVNVKFTTSEGMPGKVRGITETNITPNEITLLWENPEEKNGEIDNYEIAYRVLKGIACTNNESNAFDRKNANGRTVILDNLRPYTTYEIIIRANTKSTKGEEASTFANTLQADLNEKERLKIAEAYKISKDYVSLRYKPLKCSELNGPLLIKAEMVCISDWCNGKSALYYDGYNPENILNINDIRQPLIAFTTYNVSVSISRSKTDVWNNSDFLTVQTSPDVPHKVSQANVYSKTESYIAVRWKPPYPPTGTLAQYRIDYNYITRYRTYSYSSYTLPTECFIWKDFHCVNITKEIYTGYSYTFRVYARNQEFQDFGPGSDTINVFTRNEGPQLPYNLNYTWSKNNDLTISFYHPNNTNGPLTSFEIQIDKQKTLQKIDTFKLVYAYKINVQFAACRTVDYRIQAHNIYASSGFTNSKIKTPPAIPPNITITHSSSNISIGLDLNFTEIIDTIYLIKSDTDNTEDLSIFEKNLEQNQNDNLTNSVVLFIRTNVNEFEHFDVGNASYEDSSNPPLEPGKNYSIAIYLVNSCNEIIRFKRYWQFLKTDENPLDPSSRTTDPPPIDGSGNGALWALLLLIIVPIIVFGIWYASKKNPKIQQLIKTQQRPPMDDQIILTDTAQTNHQKAHVIKPKPSIRLPAVSTKHSRKIRITELENYVKEAIETGELEKQHNLFDKGLLKPHDVGSSAQNKNKNRYRNLIAYDHTRVKLKRTPTKDQTDYINANYIDGYRKPKAYIATQGPKANTLNDFWSMIWQTNVEYIIMLANILENGKKKVEKYWPDINEDIQYGDVKVHYLSSSVFANYDERLFNVSCDGESRKITQLHFTTWPDHGVPLYSQSLVPFLQKMLKIPYNTQSPILVHCSAGVGRTGTIILSHICLCMAAGEGHIDFLAHLENLRNQRANLVDNIEQYKLAHLVVLECLSGMRTSIPCNDDMHTIIESTISNNGVKTQMKYILETQWQDSAMETIMDIEEIVPIYPEKNRFEDIIPEHYRVFITRYPHDDETSSYINAVLVDEFSNPGRYIVTQQPLPNTLGDFWRLVLERSCSVIISLNTIDLNDKTVCAIWPEKGEELQPVDFIKIVHKKTQKLDFYRIITVDIQAEKTGANNLLVNIVAMDNWRPEDLLPNSIEEFLTFRDAADALCRASETVMVTCYDGAKASGLYLAMSFLIEKMKLEQECDVCLAVRSIRHSRKQFVTAEEQYEFLLRASLTYITGFQSYSNFV